MSSLGDGNHWRGRDEAYLPWDRGAGGVAEDEDPLLGGESVSQSPYGGLTQEGQAQEQAGRAPRRACAGPYCLHRPGRCPRE